MLYDEHSVHKVELITKNIGMVYSGMGPDYRYGSQLDQGSQNVLPSSLSVNHNINHTDEAGSL